MPAAPDVPVGQRQFSPAVVDMVMAAMADVISSEPLSTGRVVHAASSGSVLPKAAVLKKGRLSSGVP